MILMQKFRALVERLEELPVGPGAWTAGFLGIVAVRHLLELKSGGFPMYPPSALFAHYVLAYLAPLLALCLVLSLTAGVAIVRVLRLMLLMWGLTLLPPFVDMLVARSHDAKIGYLELGTTPLTTVFVRFFDPTFALGGTTAGIRVEALVACLLGAGYVIVRGDGRARILRALAAVLGVYLTALGFFTAPYLFVRLLAPAFPGLTPANLYNAQGLVPRPTSLDVRSDQGILLYLVPLTLLLAAATLARFDGRALRRVVRTLAASEGWLWSIAAGAGAWAGLRILDGVPHAAPLVPFDLLAMIEGPLALLIAGGAVALLARPGDDPITEPAQPVSVPEASAQLMSLAGIALLAAAICLAPACSINFACYAALGIGAGALARGAPRYLPAVPLLPQLAAAMAVLAAFLAGYALRADDEAVTLLPGGLLLAVLGAGFLADLPRAVTQVHRTVWESSVRWAGIAGAALAPIVILLAAFSVPATGRTTASWIGGIAFAAGIVVLGRALPVRMTSALAMLAASLLVVVHLGSSPAAGAWRTKALASPAYYERLSVRAEGDGNLDLAIGAAGEALRLSPNSAAAHARLGLLRHARKDEPGAIAELEAAVALAPQDDALACNLATVLLAAGRADAALARVDSVLARKPRLASAIFVRAQALDALGRRPEAEISWRAFLEVAAGEADEAAYIPIVRQRLGLPPGS